MLSSKNVVVVEAWNTTTTTQTQTPHRPSLLHPTFYWGYNCQVLFSGWPGSDRGMYALALIFVFFLAFLAEWLARCSDASSTKPGADKLAKVAFRTAMYAVKSGFSYLVILAVVSFNGGVFLAAIFGHALGFAVFRGRAFRNMGRVDG
ncbi:Ctr copper transporter [Arabidopsis thaliana x Arabidopsis arenosa]|uniref:Copper transport protein n=2 Tax=Arabidopsis TaxID=3701 RepID=A0A8T2AD74_9BRAS|nr:Ctr copper transporter [Arabidopsis thaliana x Arabidopsis arenosa]